MLPRDPSPAPVDVPDALVPDRTAICLSEADAALLLDAHRRRSRVSPGIALTLRAFRVPFPSPLRSPEPVAGMWGAPFRALVEWPAVVDPMGIPLFRLPGMRRFAGILEVAEHVLFPDLSPTSYTRDQRLAVTALARCALCIRMARLRTSGGHAAEAPSPAARETRALREPAKATRQATTAPSRDNARIEAHE